MLAAATFMELHLGGTGGVQPHVANTQLNLEERFVNDNLEQRNDCSCIWESEEEDGGCNKFDEIRKTHMCQVVVDDENRVCMGIDYKAAVHDEESGAWWAACQVNQGRFQCWNFPCENGGFCIDGVDNYECVCQYDDAGQRYLYKGETCEHEIDECVLMGDEKVCDPNAFCLNVEAAYKCECMDGFFGSGYATPLPLPSWVQLGSMEMGCADIDDCASNPCYNGGTCLDDGHIPNNFECTCFEGWEGDQCRIDIDECDLGTANCDAEERASCANTDGSFQCSCDEGWTGDGYEPFSSGESDVEGITGYLGCEDVDDCASIPCEHGGTCFDHGDGTGEFDCECVLGWHDHLCDADDDECTLERDNCHADAYCDNNPGSFECFCNNGWTGDGVFCIDADDCEFSPCQNGGTCHDCGTLCLICDCIVGWRGRTCEIDWDECFMGIHTCHDYALCDNTPGSFECACEPGYSGDGYDQCDDVNDCVTYLPGLDDDPLMFEDDVVQMDTNGSAVHPCGIYDASADVMTEHGTCRDMGADHFICNCEPGWSDSTCDHEIDECGRGIDSCHRMATCTNTAGSYTCACNYGFTGDGVVACSDMDDCASEENKCKYGTCIDLGPFDHRCICSPGWTENSCDWDIDECSERTHQCGQGATCANTDGSYDCSCPEGTEGDATIECLDLDDCAISPCEHGDCTDHGASSFVCTCDPAWTDFLCDYDVNECFLGTHDCHGDAKCVNTPGAFYCRCVSGYQGDGYTCLDLDDCDPDPCDPDHGTCFDHGANSYTCECEPGFCEAGCEGDCNECMMGTHNCHEDAQCQNTWGSYVCTCNERFFGDGEHCAQCTVCEDGYKEDPSKAPCHAVDRTCVNVNECGEMLSNCDEHAECSDTVGSYTCTCDIDDNWTGEGIVDRCTQCHECPDGYHMVKECTSSDDRVCEPNMVDGLYVIETTAGGLDQCLIFSKGEGAEHEYPTLYNWGYGSDWCGVGDWNGNSQVHNLREQGVAVFRVRQILPWHRDYSMQRHNLYTVESSAGLEDYRCLGFSAADQTYPSRRSFGPNPKYCGQTAKEGENAMLSLLTGEAAGFVWKMSPIGAPEDMRFTMETMVRGNLDSDDEQALDDPDDWECLFFSRGGTGTSPSRPLKRDALFGNGDLDLNGYPECGISLAGGAPNQAEALLQNKQAVFRFRLLQAEGGPLLPDRLPVRLGGIQTSAYDAATWAMDNRAELEQSGYKASDDVTEAPESM